MYLGQVLVCSRTFIRHEIEFIKPVIIGFGMTSLDATIQYHTAYLGLQAATLYVIDMPLVLIYLIEKRSQQIAFNHLMI